MDDGAGLWKKNVELQKCVLKWAGLNDQKKEGGREGACSKQEEMRNGPNS
jgi:hypothetical protein